MNNWLRLGARRVFGQRAGGDDACRWEGRLLNPGPAPPWGQKTRRDSQRRWWIWPPPTVAMGTLYGSWPGMRSCSAKASSRPWSTRPASTRAVRSSGVYVQHPVPFARTSDDDPAAYRQHAAHDPGASAVGHQGYPVLVRQGLRLGRPLQCCRDGPTRSASLSNLAFGAKTPGRGSGRRPEYRSRS